MRCRMFRTRSEVEVDARLVAGGQQRRRLDPRSCCCPFTRRHHRTLLIDTANQVHDRGLSLRLLVGSPAWMRLAFARGRSAGACCCSCGSLLVADGSTRAHTRTAASGRLVGHLTGSSPLIHELESASDRFARAGSGSAEWMAAKIRALPSQLAFATPFEWCRI